MSNQSAGLERSGPHDKEDDFLGVLRGHVLGTLSSDGRISVTADNYYPEGRWNIDEYEDRCCHLSAPATRENWRFLYQVGRALSRNGKVTIIFPDPKDNIEIACDGSEVIIS